MGIDIPIARIEMLEAALGGRAAVVDAYEQQKPLAGGGPLPPMAARTDFADMTWPSFVTPMTPDLPTLVLATVDMTGDGNNCSCIMRMTDGGDTTWNVTEVFASDLASGQERRNPISSVVPAGWQYQFQFTSNTGLGYQVYEQPLLTP